MSIEQTACEDLKAFERRLTEVITCLQPSALRWRVVLVTVSACTAIGAYQWLTDPTTSEVAFVQSLFNHLFFAISTLTLAILFLMGIHKRVVAPSIICCRTRQVLADFNMWCDDTGKLVLKPRPTASS
ncbi:Nuclear envelope phosphatase-regulatory subunit 1 [Amphibalanus amphitrite]|uniref:Transmembrane protein 188 n=1 Tax=Amphibalanus amphitrite TaxID=1232801 RepID=A0A6A4V506_AMPAM|nr:nuclear envelope phosphatase-regulatory subunit 1-like [Amphibalanus amphitrite]KAF0288833.1 Nuclear envelope phosphatase-regulatory subunit 1 [Amphibalanus amphitrite]KAF0295336.1 Nuclear envelope phosphatase-regulatory subunit 1 [Amphibalanus amphitrite]